MHREDLLARLENYLVRWPDEEAVARRFTEFIRSHPDCLERSLQVGHITGSAWLVNRAGTHVLLTHHRKLGMWLQLGGHVDGNPDVLDAALREACEESGLSCIEPVGLEIFDIDVHPIPAHKGEPAHHHYDIRHAFRTCGSENYVVSEESHNLAWVEIESLNGFTAEESMLRMAKKWLAVHSTPGSS